MCSVSLHSGGISFTNLVVAALSEKFSSLNLNARFLKPNEINEKPHGKRALAIRGLFSDPEDNLRRSLFSDPEDNLRRFFPEPEGIPQSGWPSTTFRLADSGACVSFSDPEDNLRRFFPNLRASLSRAGQAPLSVSRSVVLGSLFRS